MLTRRQYLLKMQLANGLFELADKLCQAISLTNAARRRAILTRRQTLAGDFADKQLADSSLTNYIC